MLSLVRMMAAERLAALGRPHHAAALMGVARREIAGVLGAEFGESTAYVLAMVRETVEDKFSDALLLSGGRP